ncbi:MAG: hypothetical protein Tsb005_12160 [Gammaproteobacteria bacterium]
MKKEYELKKLKVKRRGVLPALQAEDTASNKVRITIALDKDVVDYFKEEAAHPGAFPYQTQINQALRQLIDKRHGTGAAHGDIEELKSELLHDPAFIRELAKALARRQAGK